MKKIPFCMITGFLGSGKTTLLKHILHSYSGSGKIGIVQNEFAPASVDGFDLKRSGLTFALLEVNNGSVFCVCLLGNFIKSLAAFIDEKLPDMVILESSGLSDPIAIAQILQAPPLEDKLYLSHIWCVIDCFNFNRIAIAETQVSRQVRVADTVILNKTDLCHEKISTIRNKILSWNAQAEIITAQYCRISFVDFSLPIFIQPVAVRNSDENKEFQSVGRPDAIHTAVLKTGAKISPGNFDIFLETVVPDCYRMKGFIRLDNGATLFVQSSFGITNKSEIPGYSGITELIMIGPKVSAGELSRKFNVLSGS
ncbi:MAG: GTP-binding protein [Bacteroidales bacterium]|nr:GTP-binding protein [Bacteroidales bacterium]